MMRHWGLFRAEVTCAIASFRGTRRLDSPSATHDPRPRGSDCPAAMSGARLTGTTRSTARSRPRTASGLGALCGSVRNPDDFALDGRHGGMARERCGAKASRKRLRYVHCARASTAAIGTNFHLLLYGVATPQLGAVYSGRRALPEFVPKGDTTCSKNAGRRHSRPYQESNRLNSGRSTPRLR